MHLVDVHAHLDHPDFASDLPDVLSRAKAKGVVTVISQGINHESNQRVLELARTHDMVKAALGLYPSEADTVTLSEGYERETAFSVETTLQFIEDNSKDIVAIGEVGMDFKESQDRTSQKELFRRIIRLAKRLRKPLIIHSRKAEQEVLDLLEEEQCKRAVLHCFMGKKSLVQRGVKMGLSFSIPSAVTRVPQFEMNAELIPTGQLLTETDSPYLSPLRGIRNEPGTVRDAILKLAEIKRMDPGEFANTVYFNYQKLFQ